MAMNAEQRLKLAALHRQWWHLLKSEKYLSDTQNPKQRNKNNLTSFLIWVNQLFVYRFWHMQVALNKTNTSKNLAFVQ